MPCGETGCSSSQTSLTWVCLQQTSWTLDVSSARSSRVPFIIWSLLGTGRSCRGRDVWRIRWVRQQLHLLVWLLCAHWHFPDEEKGHAVASLGGAGTERRRTSGRRWCTHQSTRADCPSVLKRNDGGDVARFSEDTGDQYLLSASWFFDSSGNNKKKKNNKIWN